MKRIILFMFLILFAVSFVFAQDFNPPPFPSTPPPPLDTESGFKSDPDADCRPGYSFESSCKAKCQGEGYTCQSYTAQRVTPGSQAPYYTYQDITCWRCVYKPCTAPGLHLNQGECDDECIKNNGRPCSYNRQTRCWECDATLMKNCDNSKGYYNTVIECQKVCKEPKFCDVVVVGTRTCLICIEKPKTEEEMNRSEQIKDNLDKIDLSKVPGALRFLLGSPKINIEVDDSVYGFKLSGEKVEEFVEDGFQKPNYIITLSEETLDSILESDDIFSKIEEFYSKGEIIIEPQTIGAKIKFWLLEMFV